MNRTASRRPTQRTALMLAAVVLLLAAMLAALGAGPDEPAASNVGSNWQAFEGHAFANSRIVPEGVSLVACLAGCEQGYVSDPVSIGPDGRYDGLKVAPRQGNLSALPDADVITFWLLGHDGNVQAVQWALFSGDGQTRQLHLSFAKLPVPSRSAATAAATGHDTVTTDLTVPDADRLGLTPAHSPRGYVNSWAYGSMPVLPGLTIVAGILLAVIGGSMLMRRRRMTW